MASCEYCGAETSLFLSGVPICIQCADDIDDGHRPPYNRERKPAAPEKRDSDFNRQQRRLGSRTCYRSAAIQVPSRSSWQPAEARWFSLRLPPSRWTPY